MKKKIRWMLVSLFCMMAFFVLDTQQVEAAVTADEFEQIVDGSKLTEDLESEGTWSPLERWRYLATGKVIVGNQGNGEIAITGSTGCVYVCDSVYLNLYLEQYSGGTWKSYRSWEYIDYNTSVLNKSISLSVPKGYYYRGRAYHACRVGSTKESGSSITNGIKIS